MININTQPPRYIDGYPSLAAFIASDKDGTTAIYKRFNRLAARNLLLLQSELADLQVQLDKFDLEDQGTMETLQSLRNWEDFKERSATDPSRMELVKKIRETLKEYSEMILVRNQNTCVFFVTNSTEKEKPCSSKVHSPGFRHRTQELSRHSNTTFSMHFAATQTLSQHSEAAVSPYTMIQMTWWRCTLLNQ